MAEGAREGGNTAQRPNATGPGNASIAQLAEHALSKRKVASSILAGGSTVRHGVVGNISACHADARGSIPRDGVYFLAPRDLPTQTGRSGGAPSSVGVLAQSEACVLRKDEVQGSKP